MKVVGLDGRTYSWKLAGHVPLDSDDRPRSSNHIRARALLATLFPADQRLEEVSLPGSGGLFADFYLPNRKFIIEVHGAQHFRFNGFFHETRLDFVQAQARDRRKAEWCQINNIRLIELAHDQSDESWAERIIG